MPRGLYCWIMKYWPVGKMSGAPVRVGVEDVRHEGDGAEGNTLSESAVALPPPDAKPKNQVSRGVATTDGAMALPEAAPLYFQRTMQSQNWMP